MLIELAVSDLGVISDLSLVFGRGMTALTGETGAGKTLVVEAIDLLTGGRSDASRVRPGAAEARVEGRFALGDEELVLARVVPRDGRTRAYLNGQLATVGALAEQGARLVDLHGQHAHQSLLATAVQRSALDRFGGVDLGPLESARADLAAIDEQLGELGGDDRTRAQEIDYLRFQVTELTDAELDDPDEDERLAGEEERLADAVAHQAAGEDAYAALVDEGGARDAVASASAAVAERSPFDPVAARLRTVEAELADLASELRTVRDSIEDDPQRLEAVRGRRAVLADLRRKYADVIERSDAGPHGPARTVTLADLLAFRERAVARLAELESYEERAAQLEAQRADADAAVDRAAAQVGAARREAAPRLGDAATDHLVTLAMPKARLEVEVGDDPGDEVAICLAANPGLPAQPLSKVASGGELARTMLALRLVLSAGPPCLVFDEVDAGVGGEAAQAVGRALAEVSAHHQVLVVTHLPQVAAFADHQVLVQKADEGQTTSTTARPVEGDQRLVELSRMLSGSPDSDTAQRHAGELLEAAARQRRG